MSRRKLFSHPKNFRAAPHAATPRHAPARSSPRRGVGGFAAPKAESAASPWRCLLSSIAIGVAPLRNLTGDADQQNLLDQFTNDLTAARSRVCTEEPGD